MAKKIRKIIDGKVQWFGGYRNVGGQNTYQSPMLEINTEEDYIEAYKYRIYNMLNIIKKELKDKSFGISGVFAKKSKEEIDIEIRQALYTKLNLLVNEYVSEVKDRQYTCRFTVTTPKGNVISLEAII